MKTVRKRFKMGEFPNKSTQFSSTNQPESNGRPKGSKNFKSILNKVLDGVMTIQEAGEAKQMTKRELLAMELAIIALDRKAKKNERLKAIDMILDRLEGKPSYSVNAEVEGNITIGWQIAPDNPVHTSQEADTAT